MDVISEPVFFHKAVKRHAEEAEPDVNHVDAPGRETDGQNHGKNGHAVQLCFWQEAQRRADQAHTAHIEEGACKAAVAGGKIVRRRFGRKAQQVQKASEHIAAVRHEKGGAKKRKGKQKKQQPQCLFGSKLLPRLHFELFSAFAARFAAATTWESRTEVVTAPTPPGTGVIASTIGSTSS